MYVKTRELYQLSLQKGIKYLNNAMIFYFIGFAALFIKTILDFTSDGMYGTFQSTSFGLILVFLNIFGALLGGYFLAYCLVWRNLEGHIKYRNIMKKLVLYVIALFVVAIDMCLIVFQNMSIPILFYVTVIGALLFAIVSNHKRCCKMHIKTKDPNPFLSFVGLALGIYIFTLIENLFVRYLFTIHYYMWGLHIVFTLAFLYHIIKLSK
jgi:hypothetical protein